MAKKASKKTARKKAPAKKKAPVKKATTKKKVTKKTGKRRGRVPRHAPTTPKKGDVAVVAPKNARTNDEDQHADWEDWYQEYVDALGEEYSHTAAAARVGRSTRTTERHRKACESFAKACDEAWNSVVDQLEASAMKRGIKGTVRPIMYKDRPVGAERQYETALTIFLLKTNRRDKYAQDASGDERDAREAAREFRAAMAEMEDSIPTDFDDLEEENDDE